MDNGVLFTICELILICILHLGFTLGTHLSSLKSRIGKYTYEIMAMKNVSLDVCLEEIHKQFIAVKERDVKLIFENVFHQVKQKMGEQCNFFNKYSTQVLYAGSMYDGVKITKLDEFDMDIVIRLPINYDDSENGIIIENDKPGFVKLKIGRAFDNLSRQQEWENCHRVTYDWRDENKYLLQNKFRDWMQSVVKKALNSMNNQVVVNGVKYMILFRASGPAYTLNIRNTIGEAPFNLDVDLVPVIRFLHPRWPKGYRTMNGTNVKDWLVVPKPNKAIKDEKLKNRCWRLSFQNFEREMIKDLKQLKMGIRLVKKLRDVLGMKSIASYYIKTVFMWKIQKVNQKTYWQNRISVIFRDMVQELYDAINKGCIAYYWNENHNLIDGVRPTVLKLYAEKLKNVLNSIDANYVEKVVHCLLTSDEIRIFKHSNFYSQHFNVDSIGTQMKAVHLDSLHSNSKSNKGSQILCTIDNKIKTVTTDSTNVKDHAEKDKQICTINKNQKPMTLVDPSKRLANSQMTDGRPQNEKAANEKSSCTIC